MEHLWTLASVLVGAFLGYFFGLLAERSNRRRSIYDEATRFLAEYRVQATSSLRSLNTTSELLSRAVWLDRKIADEFSRRAFEAWQTAYRMMSAEWIPFDRTYEFDLARDNALDEMVKDLKLWRCAAQRTEAPVQGRSMKREACRGLGCGAVVALGLASLVAWPRSLAAACGWVLWVETDYTLITKEKGSDESVFWTINSALPKYEGCESARLELWKSLSSHHNLDSEKGVEKIERTPYSTITEFLKPQGDLIAGSTMTRVVCLPDTVDPRGKQ